MLITSAANPTVKRVRALGARKQREAEGATVVSGIQPVRQAVEAGMHVETLLVAEDLLAAPSAREFVTAQEAAGTPVARLSGELFTRVFDRDRPTGLAAVVRLRVWSLDALGDGPLLALERLANPGNLGTILRTADASGAGGVLLVGPTADPWDPAAVKASMGAVFHVPAVRLPDADALFAWAAGQGVAVATTAGRAAKPLWSASLPERVVVLLGSEGDGLSDGTLARGDVALSIPMAGHAESLNVAVAAGIVLYELQRRRAASGP